MGGCEPRTLDVIKQNRPLEIIAGCMSLLAAWLVADKIYLEGFVIHIIGDGLWMWWGQRTKAWGLAITQLIFFIISVYGLYNL